MTTIRHVPILPLPDRHETREKSFARDRHCDPDTSGRSVPGCTWSGAFAIWRSSTWRPTAADPTASNVAVDGGSSPSLISAFQPAWQAAANRTARKTNVSACSSLV